ncbi:hypothetical protein J0A68_20685 [Algoriphagus sp. H41]|uniref:HTH luxR-type domain-containing protein n=1 Tax=Algoriphagus oliviformis TaxID=2811231 RepID=A0ABS3CCM3_9BACT|nr:hypothetical protein [Algoriphagus oliviformis]MBN7813384.1 hypothetical protein [Algoriphagus oliviformis]
MSLFPFDKLNISRFPSNALLYATLLGLILLIQGTVSTAQTTAQPDNYTNPVVNLQKNEAKYSNPDSSILHLKTTIEQLREQKDTVNLIKSLNELSSIYAHLLDYGNSYDGYWEALLLADQINHDFLKAKIYQELGWLYSFYHRDEEALKYFNLALSINKELYRQNTGYGAYVISDFFALINFYRVNGDYANAAVYLDSCYQLQKEMGSSSMSYILAEDGYLDGMNGDYPEAMAKLAGSMDFFKKNDRSYLIVIHTLIGDILRKKGDLRQSAEHYNQALHYSETFQSHSNHKLMAHEALASIYSLTRQFDSAYLHSREVNRINAEIFGPNSKNNKHLFRINDQYRLQKEKEKELIKEQHIANLEHEERMNTMQLWLLAVVLLSLFVYGLLLVKNIRRKHQLEKKALAEKRALELQKTNEILELKNKELTTTALQIIEKDEFIEKLRNNLSDDKGLVDVNSLKKMIKSVQGTPGSNWKEFEARFTAINESFYENLQKGFPELTQADLKICALVKLNFSSKEMASLLGISIESVHTSRYRLRKKFNIDRNENLVEFIAGFS